MQAFKKSKDCWCDIDQWPVMVLVKQSSAVKIIAIFLIDT